MRVRLDGWAWVAKAEFTADQLDALRAHLTVTLRKDGDDGPKEVLLYREHGEYLGVPREYYLPKRKVHHTLDDHTTTGDKTGWPGALRFNPARQLKPEQAQALEMIQRYFALGPRGGILRAAPGWGKTVCTSAIIAAMDVPTLVVVHKEFLKNQWRDRLEEYLPGIQIGVAQGDVCDYEGKHVVLGMVHSLSGRKYEPAFYRHFGLIAADECFVASQLVGTPRGLRRIDGLVAGDTVFTAVGTGTVEAAGSRLVPVADLCVVRLIDGTEYVCTRDHPFLAETAWVQAACLEGRTVLTRAACVDTMRRYGHNASASFDVSDVRETRVGTRGAAVLFEALCGGGHSAGRSDAGVRCVREAGETTSMRVLFDILSAEAAPNLHVGSAGGYLRSGVGVACTESGRRAAGVGTHDSPESDGACGCAIAAEGGVAGAGLPALDTGRERSAPAGAAATLAGDLGVRVEGGVGGTDEGGAGSGAGASIALQDRSGVSGHAVGDRGRRGVSRYAGWTRAGCEERHGARAIGVASVTGVEPRDIERLGIHTEADSGLVRVYNLRVGGHPSYVLGTAQVVVHNCHRIGAYEWAGVPGLFPARWRLGVTATPRRKDGAENVFRYHIGQEIFAAKQESLPFKTRFLYSDFYLVKTKSYNGTAGRSVIIDYLTQNETRNRLIAFDMAKALATGRKLLVVSERLEHLKLMDAALRETLTAANVPAPSIGYFVGGKTEDQLDKAAACRVIFATTQLVLEGLDIPALDTLFLTTPLADVEQAIGRIRRPCDGKRPPVVVDVRDERVAICRTSALARVAYYAKMGALDNRG